MLQIGRSSIEDHRRLKTLLVSPRKLPSYRSTNKRQINSNYRSAAYTESYLIMPKALCSYTPRPNYSGVGAVKTVPQDYSGDYSFETIQHKTDNPFRGHGFFQGKIAQASVALDKDLIFTIRHRIGEGTAA